MLKHVKIKFFSSPHGAALPILKVLEQSVRVFYFYTTIKRESWIILPDVLFKIHILH